MDPAESDAVLAYEAAMKWKPSNCVLIEVACTRSPNELFLARQAYHARYKRSLEEDVASHTAGDFRRVHFHLWTFRSNSMYLDPLHCLISFSHDFLQSSVAFALEGKVLI